MRSAKYQLVGGLSIVLICLMLLSVGGLFAQAAPASPWLLAANPTAEKISDIDLSKPLPESIISSRDCQEREVITRPQRFVAPLQAKVSNLSCVVDTGFGALAKNGYLQRAGSSISGELRTGRGDQAIMLPIPRSSTGIRLSGGSYGNFLFFYDNLEEYLTSIASSNGEVAHRLPVDYSAILKNGNGDLLSVDTTGASFSANGDWMIADIPFLAMVRINTKTREILPFMDGSNPFSAVGAAYRTTVSPDGRYAVVFSKNFEIFKLYDLSTCGAVPAVITKKVACSSRDLLPVIRQQIPGFTSVASMRLLSNYSIDVYANSVTGNATKLTRYVVTADGQKAPTYQYLALGDSFASGEGAYRYKASTDTSENMCHLSQRSYPYLISSTLSYGQSESIACSGAVMEDLITSNPDYVGQAKDGIKLDDRRYDDYLAIFKAGYLPQKEFEVRHQPNAVSVSIGGNDIGFGDIILRCIDTDTCYDNYEDRLMIADLVNKQFEPLTKTYNDVKRSADPRAKIYIIGYPQIAKPDGVCDMNVHLNNNEIKFAQQLVSHLNNVIKKAAESAGVFYVDVEDAFAGHRMCEPINSWDVAINGLTAGNDQIDLPFIHGPIGNESYHPNALGHSLLKDKILEKTNNFTSQNPTPNPGVAVPTIDVNMPFLQVPKSNKTIRNLKHYTGTDGGAIQAGKHWSMEASGLNKVFAAGSKIEAWLRSEPLNLGSYTLGSQGSVNIGLDIPANMASGMHTLHLYGKNSSGEEIDLFKTVYVAGLPFCTGGQDLDKDTIDDACDGFIDKPPLVVAPANQVAGVVTDEPVSQASASPQATSSLTLAATSQTRNSETVTTTEPTVLGTNTQATPEQPVNQLAATKPLNDDTSDTNKSYLRYWPVLLILCLLVIILVFTLT